MIVAPILPGLTDSEVPAILEAAAKAGASDARYTLVRLPLTVEPVFQEWIRRVRPLQADKVEGLIRQMRGGRLNGSKWGERMVGTGPVAEQIRQMFGTFARRFGLDRGIPDHDRSLFRPPKAASGQLRLF